MKENYVIYRSNNSGGSWWLDEKDWINLEKAGWIVDWEEEDYLGAKAVQALFEGSLGEAECSFYITTGQNPDDSGCDCCGPPHDFRHPYDDDEVLAYLAKRSALTAIIKGAEEGLNVKPKGGKS